MKVKIGPGVGNAEEIHTMRRNCGAHNSLIWLEAPEDATGTEDTAVLRPPTFNTVWDNKPRSHGCR